MAMLPARHTGRTRTLTDPSREFEDIYERMGQLMNAASGDLGAVPSDTPWSPAADLTETDDAYAVHVELPGVHKDQLKVQLMDRELEITGEVKEPANGRRHHSSRRAGRFEYRTIFPGDIKATEVRAELADGILTVAVPKAEAARPSQVDVTDRPESNG